MFWFKETLFPWHTYIIYTISLVFFITCTGQYFLRAISSISLTLLPCNNYYNFTNRHIKDTIFLTQFHWHYFFTERMTSQGRIGRIAQKVSPREKPFGHERAKDALSSSLGVCESEIWFDLAILNNLILNLVIGS